MYCQKQRIVPLIMSMSSTLTLRALCGRMIIASTNFQRRTGHIGLAACLGVILGRLLKKLNGKRQKRADFVRFAKAALSSQSASANNEITRTSHSVSVWCAHKYSLYHPQPSLLLLLYEPQIHSSQILQTYYPRYFCFCLFFFLRKKMKSPCPRTIKTIND